jgi:hypothetical protein
MMNWGLEKKIRFSEEGKGKSIALSISLVELLAFAGDTSGSM